MSTTFALLYSKVIYCKGVCKWERVNGWITESDVFCLDKLFAAEGTWTYFHKGDIAYDGQF